MLSLSDVSLTRLKEVHPDLQKVVKRYLQIGTMPIVVLEGMRDMQTQKENVRKGASQTLRSRHLTGHAVDIAPFVNGKPSFAWPSYYVLAPQMKQAAKDVGVNIEWGGDWVKFKDGPHWQLPWKSYPALGVSRSVLPEETDRRRKIKKSAVIAASGSAFPFAEVAQTLMYQQEELTSGDIARLTVAAVVVVLTIAGLVWTWKG